MADSSWHWAAQPIITVLAAFIAIAAIGWNRHVARLKATVDFIEGSESKPYYKERYEAFRLYRNDETYREAVHFPKDGEGHKKRLLCMDFLNHYELAALSCRKGIIDEDFYFYWIGPVFIRDWDAAQTLIAMLRNPRVDGDPAASAAFTEFEALAKQWRQKNVTLGNWQPR
jgi:hypothetical protein